jgi:hypothetical protein
MTDGMTAGGYEADGAERQSARPGGTLLGLTSKAAG